MNSTYINVIYILLVGINIVLSQAYHCTVGEYCHAIQYSTHFARKQCKNLWWANRKDQGTSYHVQYMFNVKER